MTQRKAELKGSFIYRNGLSLVFITLTIITMVGQSYTGWSEHNKLLLEEHVKNRFC